MADPIFPAVTANTPSIVNAAGEVLAARRTVAGGVINGMKVRRAFTIQNVGTNPLFVRFGAAASPTEFHAVLRGGSGDSDGNGGSISSYEGTVFQGAIYIAGTSPKAVVTELI